MFPGKWQIPARTVKSIWCFLISFCFAQLNSTLLTGSILSSYVISLGGDDFATSLISGVTSFSIIFQLVGAYLCRRFKYYNSIVVIFATIGRICFIPVAFIPFIFPQVSVGRIAVIAILFLLTNSFVQITCPPWIAMTSALIDSSIGGRYFGLRTTLSMVVGLAAGIAVPLLLDAYASTLCYSIMIALACLAGIGDTLCYYFCEKVPVERETSNIKFRESLKNSLKDKRFVRVLVFRITYAFAASIPSTAFTMYMLTKLGLNVFVSMLVNTIPAYLGYIIFSKSWGRIVDKHGCMRAWYAAQLGEFMMLLAWQFLTPANCIPILAIGNSINSWFLAGINVAAAKYGVHGLPEGDRATSSGILSIGVNVLGGFVPVLLSGYLIVELRHAIETPGTFLSGFMFNEYQIMIAASTIMKLLVLIFIMPWVEKEKLKPFEIYRDIFAGLINTFRPKREPLP